MLLLVSAVLLCRRLPTMVANYQLLFGLLVLVSTINVSVASMTMNKTGCGETKACLFKPAGCDPNHDCTTGLIFYVNGPNSLRIEMVATSLVPSVQQQYIAVAFSNDQIMGNDAVIECTMSDGGDLTGYEPEVFMSFNKGKSNDRIFLNTEEQRVLVTDIASEIEDGHLKCAFNRQIIPQIDNKNGLIWSLDRDFYIFAATGSAQPDEVNAHDMNRGSHFYPIVSTQKINPSKLTNEHYELPAAYVPTMAPPSAPTRTPTVVVKMASSLMTMFTIVYGLFLLL